MVAAVVGRVNVVSNMARVVERAERDFDCPSRPDLRSLEGCRCLSGPGGRAERARDPTSSRLDPAPRPTGTLRGLLDQPGHPIPPVVVLQPFEVDQHESGGRPRTRLCQQRSSDGVTKQIGVPAFGDPRGQTGHAGTRLHDLQRDVGRLQERRGNLTLAVLRVRLAGLVQRRHDASVSDGVGLAECGSTIAKLFGGGREIRRVRHLSRGETRRHHAESRGQCDRHGCGRPASRCWLGRRNEL